MKFQEILDAVVGENIYKSEYLALILDKINELKRMNIIPCRESCHLGILDLI